MPEQLPIYKIKGKHYYRDKRLQEFRNIKDVNDRIDFKDFDNSMLEKPN